MNALKRDIQEGEIVIIKANCVGKAYQADRRFTVNSGFGMSHKARGTALGGIWMSDGEAMRWEGYDIDVKETEKYQLGASKLTENDVLERMKPLIKQITDAHNSPDGFNNEALEGLIAEFLIVINNIISSSSL